MDRHAQARRSTAPGPAPTTTSRWSGSRPATSGTSTRRSRSGAARPARHRARSRPAAGSTPTATPGCAAAPSRWRRKTGVSLGHAGDGAGRTRLHRHARASPATPARGSWTRRGRAFGVLSTVGLAPLPASNELGDLDQRGALRPEALRHRRAAPGRRHEAVRPRPLTAAPWSRFSAHAAPAGSRSAAIVVAGRDGPMLIGRPGRRPSARCHRARAGDGPTFITGAVADRRPRHRRAVGRRAAPGRRPPSDDKQQRGGATSSCSALHASIVPRGCWSPWPGGPHCRRVPRGCGAPYARPAREAAPGRRSTSTCSTRRPGCAGALAEDAGRQRGAAGRRDARATRSSQCWHRFEEQAAAAGARPASPGRPPSEFTLRRARARRGRRAAVARLAALYREARFSDHELDRGRRDRGARGAGHHPRRSGADGPVSLRDPRGGAAAAVVRCWCVAVPGWSRSSSSTSSPTRAARPLVVGAACRRSAWPARRRSARRRSSAGGPSPAIDPRSGRPAGGPTPQASTWCESHLHRCAAPRRRRCATGSRDARRPGAAAAPRVLAVGRPARRELLGPELRRILDRAAAGG